MFNGGVRSARRDAAGSHAWIVTWVVRTKRPKTHAPLPRAPLLLHSKNTYTTAGSEMRRWRRRPSFDTFDACLCPVPCDGSLSPPRRPWFRGAPSIPWYAAEPPGHVANRQRGRGWAHALHAASTHCGTATWNALEAPLYGTARAVLKSGSCHHEPW
eukprot:7094410-Prymnesium_polylepis.1